MEIIVEVMTKRSYTWSKDKISTLYILYTNSILSGLSPSPLYSFMSVK